jgi:peptide/nickel transport system ATP-binding protein
MVQSDLLIDVSDLSVAFPVGEGWRDVVRTVDLGLARGERLAIVGESGSGKSMSVRALLGMVPRPARVEARRLAVCGVDVLAASASDLRALRGRRVAMIVQDPRQGLTPVTTIGDQIVEMVRLHHRMSRRAARNRAIELLDEVHIRDPHRTADLYPHEVSGGMAQRAMIAMMLSGEPEVLIADEATSALDSIVQHRILDLIDEAIARRNMGLILISHDLGLVSRHADRVAVMYGGRIIESLDASALRHAQHPYTQGLLACRPSLDRLGEPLPVLERELSWLA